MWIPEILYEKIVSIMPLPCVDILIVNQQKGILLVKRKNEPAMKQWWFPGGRVFFGESREDAALRKLYIECGLKSKTCQELGTYDLILPLFNKNFSHAITTVYQVETDSQYISLDSSSEKAEWRSQSEWLQENLNPFVKNIIYKVKV